MRIPVTQADLAQGRLTKIARALEKILPINLGGLMKAQNTLCTLLGYRDLHDAQANATSTIPPGTKWTRTLIVNTVAWKLHRLHHMTIGHAHNLVQKLHLQTLDVDALTLDAANERLHAKLQSEGRMVIVDEWHSFFDTHWNERTPELLDAGVPPYSYAILPNEDIFQWSKLEDLIDKLPPDHALDLEHDRWYLHYPDANARSIAYIASELVPQACTPIAQATHNPVLLPEGMKIAWVFSKETGHTAYTCIGRVLHNTQLGGIIPVIYPVATEQLFQDIARLLCGEPIHGTTHPTANAHDLYINDLLGMGYDYAQEVEKHLAWDDGPRFTKKLPPTIRYLRTDGRAELCGHTFEEAGQTYIRYQTWMDSATVPPTLRDAIPADLTVGGQQDSPNAIPTVAEKLHQHLTQQLAHTIDRAWAQLQDPKTLETCLQQWIQYLPHHELDAHCEALITQELTEMDQEGSEVPMAEDDQRNEKLRMHNHGEELKRRCPSLQDLSATTVGYLLLVAQREYPGSMTSMGVEVPLDSEPRELAKVAMERVVQAFCATSASPRPEQNLNSDVLAILLTCTPNIPSAERLWQEYRQWHDFMSRLAQQTKFMATVQTWRNAQQTQRDIRAKGEYLGVGKPVNRKKPRGLMEMYGLAHSKGFVVAPQDPTAP